MSSGVMCMCMCWRFGPLRIGLLAMHMGNSILHLHSFRHGFLADFPNGVWIAAAAGERLLIFSRTRGAEGQSRNFSKILEFACQTAKCISGAVKKRNGWGVGGEWVGLLVWEVEARIKAAR